MNSEINPVSLTVPLLFILVVELSSVGREIDLVQSQNIQRDPLGMPKLSGILPPLGRFNFIHAANLGIIITGIIVSFIFSRIELYYVNTLLCWISFVILPALEVDEYSDILSSEGVDSHWIPVDGFYSFHIHFLSSSVIVAAFTAYRMSLPSQERYRIVDQQYGLVFGGIIIILYAVCYLAFLWTLTDELENFNCTTRPQIAR